MTTHAYSRALRAFRSIAIAALLLPLSINGLEIVCVVQPAPEAPRPAPVAAADAADCAASCALPRLETDTPEPEGATSKNAARSREICLLAPTDHAACMAASGGGIAVPVASVVVMTTTRAVSDDALPEVSALYRDPVLTSLSPPPKA